MKRSRSLIEKILMIEIVRAMWVVFRHLFVRGVTFQYPHVKRVLPDTHRGALALLRYDDGVERCVGCDLCEAACPSRCIKVVSEQVPGQPLVRWAPEFYIDMTKCVFCGFCVEACPCDAIRMDTGNHAVPYDSREQFIYRKDLLMSFTGRDGSQQTENPRHEPGDATHPGLSREAMDH